VLQDTDFALAPKAPPGVPNLYRRSDPNCGQEAFELLTSVAPPGFEPEPGPPNSYYVPEIQGYAADGSASVYRADAALTPDALPTKAIYQVYHSQGGKLRLVSVLPFGEGAADVHSSVGTAQGNLGEFREDSVYRAVSSDGSRIYWTASMIDGESPTPVNKGGGQGNQPGALYLRVNAGQAQSALSEGATGLCTDPITKACTYEVSGLVNTLKPARFWTANSDGTKALFSIETSVDKEDLYEFEAVVKKGKIETSVALIAQGFKGMMGASKDLSRIYLASTEDLAAGASAGKPNLYLFNKGSGFRYVTELAGQDVADSHGLATPPSPVASIPSKRTARVSPDGLHLVFDSFAPLTGYDNTDISSGRPDSEVFVYDATASGGAGELLCISCNPSGARAKGREVAAGVNGGPGIWAAAQIPGWEYQLHPSNVLAPDGRRVFFESFEGLVLRDTNGKRDVYQWERGTSPKACEEIGAELFVKSAGGCIGLISSGESAGDSEFIDASASGSDVFFTTQSSLLPQDYGLVDVYDARENGGFPSPLPPKEPCDGEACQTPAPPPNDPTPSSTTFEGPVNPKPGSGKKQGCAKGKHKVRRNGKSRCVPNKSKGKQGNKGRAQR